MNTSQTVEKKGKRYHHGDLKAQLVEATRALVEEQGPDHFSVAQACRLAGVSTAAPYRHFETRQDMLDAVAEEGLERMTSSLRHAAAAHPRGSIEAVTELGRAYVAFAGREPGVYRLMFSSEADRPEERVAEMREQGMRCFGVVLGEVAQHMGAGPEDPRVLETGFQLWTLVHGLAFLIIDGKFRVLDMAVDVDAMLRSAAEKLLVPQA